MYMHDMSSYQAVIESYIVEKCACHKVRMAARAVTRAYDDALRPVGLRATQLAVLVAIAVEGAMSITALAKFMIMDRSTLTRNLRPLEQEGLVAVGRSIAALEASSRDLAAQAGRPELGQDPQRSRSAYSGGIAALIPE